MHRQAHPLWHSPATLWAFPGAVPPFSCASFLQHTTHPTASRSVLGACSRFGKSSFVCVYATILLTPKHGFSGECLENGGVGWARFSLSQCPFFSPAVTTLLPLPAASITLGHLLTGVLLCSTVVIMVTYWQSFFLTPPLMLVRTASHLLQGKLSVFTVLQQVSHLGSKSQNDVTPSSLRLWLGRSLLGFVSRAWWSLFCQIFCAQVPHFTLQSVCFFCDPVLWDVLCTAVSSNAPCSQPGTLPHQCGCAGLLLVLYSPFSMDHIPIAFPSMYKR